MKKIRKAYNYFTPFERVLWAVSVALIVDSYVVFGGNGLLTLIASVTGVTSLVLNAKGNPLGQLLMVLFSIMYGYISYTFSYYGEMITYLGMTAPMAVTALVAWIRNPYNGNHAEVEINSITKKEVCFMLVLSAFVTLIFYYVLKSFGTSSLALSTLSVTTSFIAVYLTFRRSSWYAVAYAANDVVLVALWTIASFENTGYVSVVICFVVFFVNDLYGFANWCRIRRKQQNSKFRS